MLVLVLVRLLIVAVAVVAVAAVVAVVAVVAPSAHTPRTHAAELATGLAISSPAKVRDGTAIVVCDAREYAIMPAMAMTIPNNCWPVMTPPKKT